MKDYEYIRIAYNHYGHSIRKISKDTGISRPAIKKAIEGMEPKYRMSKTRQKPVMGEHVETVKKWLLEDKKMSVKQRHTAQRVYDRLVEEFDFKGGKSTVRLLVQNLKSELNLTYREVFIPSDPEKRQGAEMDWGEVEIELKGKKTKAYMFCMRAKYSGKIFVKLYPVMVQECFFNGHIEAFLYYGGVFPEIIYDNLSTAVKKVLKGTNRLEQTAFVAFRSYYCYKPEFCNLAKGSEKGGVEGLVKYARRNYLTPILRCESFEKANEYLLEKCNQRDLNTTYGREYTIGELFESEREKLLTLPKKPYNNYKLIVDAKVDKYSTVKVQTNRYSVPEDYVSKKVEVELGLSDIRITLKSKLIAKHNREFQRNKWLLNPQHYLKTLHRKSRAFKTSLILTEMEQSWPKEIHNLWQIQKEKIGESKGTKDFLETMAFFKDLDLTELVTLVEIAIENKTTSFDSIRVLHQSLSEEYSKPEKASVGHLDKIAGIELPAPDIKKFDALMELENG